MLLITLPVIIPLTTAALCLLLLQTKRLMRAISFIGALGHFGVSILLFKTVLGNGIQVVQIGRWEAPFGISLVCDLFSAIMVLVTGFLGCMVMLFSLSDISEDREKHGFHSLFHVLLMGVSGAFLTGDLFNLFVWFEVLLMSSFALMTLGSEKKQLEGAIKYVLISSLSSLFFLSAVGILYGVAGTLNMADLAVKLSHDVPDNLVITLSILFMLAFGIKAAIFPMYFWLPASYHTPPSPVAAIFAGLLTKVGIYSLVRVFTLVFTSGADIIHPILLVAAGLTMITGILGALAQTEMRRILSFQIVSHVGYMLMGLGLFTPLSIAGSVFYSIHHMIVIANLFLMSSLVTLACGSTRFNQTGGLYAAFPFFAFLFAVAAFALSGVPPLSGFFPKFTLIVAALSGQEFVLVFISSLVGLLTLYSMSQIWSQVFWKAAPVDHSPQVQFPGKTMRLLPVTILTAASVFIGVYAEPVFQISLRAALELLNPMGYIQAVLGPGVA